jgi:hypothetical protein
MDKLGAAIIKLSNAPQENPHRWFIIINYEKGINVVCIMT